MADLKRYTPLPPIGSSAGDSDYDEEEENESPNFDEVDLDGVSMDDVFAELRTKLSHLSKVQDFSKMAAISDIMYLSAAADKYRNSVDGPKLGAFLTSISFVELFQKVMKNHFDELFDEDHVENYQFLWYNVYALLLVMWNMSDKSKDIDERLLKINLHSDLLKYMKSSHLDPSLINEEKPSSIVQAFIGILHNAVQKASGAREALRGCGAVDTIQPFRESSNKMVSCVSLMVQAYLVTEEENEKVNSNSEVFEYLVNLLKYSMKKESYQGVNFAPIEVIEVINKLAVNDSNKKRIVESGALPLYVQLMKPSWEDTVKAEVAHGLWILGFKCKEDILKHSGCVAGLKELLNSSDPEVKRQAEGALWILEEKAKEETSVKPAGPPGANGGDVGGHIFISYQWDCKPTVLKIRDRLKTAGFNTWIDEDDMSGSVLEAMATAVEKASVVLICLSQKYKDSPSCRTEAEYTFRLRKKIIPIRLQVGYYPDGWLGILVGSKLVFDCSQQIKYEDSVRNIIRELGSVGKQSNDLDSVDGIQKQVAPVTNTMRPSHEKTNPVRGWKKEDIDEWREKHNLKHMEDWFLNFDGNILMEYSCMRQEAPEAFFAYLLKKDFSLADALAVSKALKELY